MQELDGKNLDLHRGLVGHLMIEGMNLGRVGSHDRMRIAQYDDLEPPIAQLASGLVDLVAITRFQRRTILRKFSNTGSKKCIGGVGTR